jgi:hypothetical protein
MCCCCLLFDTTPPFGLFLCIFRLGVVSGVCTSVHAQCSEHPCPAGHSKRRFRRRLLEPRSHPLCSATSTLHAHMSIVQLCATLSAGCTCVASFAWAPRKFIFYSLCLKSWAVSHGPDRPSMHLRASLSAQTLSPQRKRTNTHPHFAPSSPWQLQTLSFDALQVVEEYGSYNSSDPVRLPCLFVCCRR